jgi:dTDP-L-rhamnose 4-epimerase
MAAYGEGAYDCPRCERDVVAERDAQRIAAGQWEPECPKCGTALRARPTPESWPTHPRSVYAITKRDQEELVLRVGPTYGITSMALRFFNVYGPGQALSNPYTGVASIFASRLLNNHPPRVYEDGAQTRDLVHVTDAAEAVRLAVEADAPSGVFNVGTGRGVSIAEVALLLEQKLGRDCPPEITGEYRTGDQRHCYADVSAAAARLGYVPSVQLEDGLDDIVATVAGAQPHDRFDAASDELRRRGVVTSSRAFQV